MGGRALPLVPDERRATGAAPDGDDLPELCPWPHMTVTQNVGYGLRFKAGVSKVDRARRAVEMLRIVQLASSSESPWRGPSSWSRRFSCSTSLLATSMQISAKKCDSRSADFANRLASRPSTLLTTRR